MKLKLNTIIKLNTGLIVSTLGIFGSSTSDEALTPSNCPKRLPPIPGSQNLYSKLDMPNQPFPNFSPKPLPNHSPCNYGYAESNFNNQIKHPAKPFQQMPHLETRNTIDWTKLELLDSFIKNATEEEILVALSRATKEILEYAPIRLYHSALSRNRTWTNKNHEWQAWYYWGMYYQNKGFFCDARSKFNMALHLAEELNSTTLINHSKELIQQTYNKIMHANAQYNDANKRHSEA